MSAHALGAGWPASLCTAAAFCWLAVVPAAGAEVGPPADARAGDVLVLRVRRGADAAVPLGTALGSAPAVVNFWASYCAPCRAEVPVLRRAAARWRARGVRVVGVATDLDDAAQLKRVSGEWGIDYESYWVPDEQQDALRRLLPKGLPATFVVHDGHARRHDRLLSEADLEALLAAALGPLPGAGPH